MKLPKTTDLAELVEALIDTHIDLDGTFYDQEFLSLTVGADLETEDGWSWQTGDNSYTGGAYGFRYWAVVDLTADSSPVEVAEEIINQLAELEAQ